MPIDTTRGARGLLDMFSDERPIVDRATLLPIGQHEDGSLTPAWPAFLKDAWDGGIRSLVAQEGSPLFDDGGQYVSGATAGPLDAFNAVSLGPISGIAGRFTGAIPGGALGSGGSDALSKSSQGIRAYRGVMTDRPKTIGQITQGQDELWASSNPRVAETYANLGDQPYEGGAVLPLDMQFGNPMTVDAGGSPFWGVPFGDELVSTADLARRARLNGHDGLIIKGVKDAIGPSDGVGATVADTYVALRPGTVHSGITGERLFANDSNASIPYLMGAIPKGALGSGGSDALPSGIRAYHGSPYDFDQFDPSRIGTGDGTAQGRGFYFAKSEREARNIGETVTGGKPHMYEVRINAPEDDFLNWDSGFVPQSAFEALDESSRTALLADVQRTGAARQWANIGGNGTSDITGQQFFEALARQHGNAGASNAIKGMGYPGISYRGLDDRSFSVFDENLISILRKYGLLGTAGLGASLLGSEESGASQEPFLGGQIPREPISGRGPADPFDRNNDPLFEVPMILNNPFADPPPPELPRMQRPLPFLLGPAG